MSFGYPGQQQANIVSRRILLPANTADSEIDLGCYCSTVIISVEAGNANLYFDPTDTGASTNNFQIPNGTSTTYQGTPIRKFRIISDNAVPNNHYSVLAY